MTRPRKKEAKPRKPRIDSIDEHVKIVQNARKIVKPPEHMEIDEKTMVYFDELISEKPKSEWTAHQITLAAMLARMMFEIDENQKLLKKEGTLVKVAGKIKENPRRKLITEYVDKITSLRRSLGIYAMASGSQKFEQFKRNYMARGIENDIVASEDDLIAQPLTVN